MTWGWTVGDLDRMAAIVVSRCRASERAHVGDPVENARGFVVDVIVDDPELDRQAIVREASRRFAQFVWDQNRERYGRQLLGWWGEYNHRPETQANPERCVPRMALRKVLDRLSPVDRERLETYAVTGSLAGCAAMWGVTVSAASKQLAHARTNAYQLWFDWETPPQIASLKVGKRGGSNTHCHNGHDLALYGRQRSRSDGRGGTRTRRYCVECVRLTTQARRSAS